MVPPSGGTKVRVAPPTKLLPLMVMVWLLVEAGYEDGTTLLMLGGGVEPAEIVSVYVAGPAPVWAFHTCTRTVSPVLSDQVPWPYAPVKPEMIICESVHDAMASVTASPCGE